MMHMAAMSRGGEMRLAVLSDIHGNLDALDAVLSDLERQEIDQVLCLGDSIGYGPQPEEVLARLIERGIPSLLGNHELAVVDPSALMGFNIVARRALRHSIAQLSQPSLELIAQMPLFAVRRGCRFVHGFPPDSATRYLFQVPETGLRAAFHALSERLCFVGHTHELALIRRCGLCIEHRRLASGSVALDAAAAYLVNVGSVGQPRDGNHDAKYLIWDDAQWCIDVRYVPYDCHAVYRKILAAGLPETYALRLL
jgi:diadenosine tetraphosphatase ApaH/serine/threonine PP2A family protein phosphatase